MDRRDFIKKGLVAATGMALTSVATASSTEASRIKSRRTLKALLINGSPRRNGNTACALSEIAKSLRKANIDVENFWIGKKSVHGCVACYACKKLGHCVFNDDPCNEIVEKIKGADAVVVGAPVYYGQPNGAMMALLQRAMMANPPGVAGKPVAGVTVCRRGGATAALQCLLMPFQMLDCLIVGSQYWNIAYGRTPGEAAKDVEGMQTMRRLGTNIAWALGNIHTDGSVTLPPREKPTPMHFIRD